MSERGGFYLLLAAVFWGSGFVSQNYALQTIHPLALVFLRYIVASVAIFPVACFSTRGMNDRGRIWKECARSGLICGLPMSVAMILQQFGLGDTGAGKGAFLSSLYVVFAPLIGILLKKKVSNRVWCAVGLSMIGSFMLCVKEGFTLSRGDILVILCAVLFAVQIHVYEWIGDGGHPIVHSLFGELTTCVVAFFLMVIGKQIPNWQQISASLLPVLYTGLFPGSVADTCAVLGQRGTSASVAALLMSLESVFGALFGVLILHETMMLREILGCVLIFSGVLLVQLEPKKTPE